MGNANNVDFLLTVGLDKKRLVSDFVSGFKDAKAVLENEVITYVVKPDPDDFKSQLKQLLSSTPNFEKDIVLHLDDSSFKKGLMDVEKYAKKPIKNITDSFKSEFINISKIFSDTKLKKEFEQSPLYLNNLIEGNKSVNKVKTKVRDILSVIDEYSSTISDKGERTLDIAKLGNYKDLEKVANAAKELDAILQQTGKKGEYKVDFSNRKELEKTVQNIQSGYGQAMSQFGDSYKTQLTQVQTYTQSVFTDLQKMLLNVFLGIGDAVSDASKQAADIIKGNIDGAVNEGSSKLDELQKKLADVRQKIEEANKPVNKSRIFKDLRKTLDDEKSDIYGSSSRNTNNAKGEFVKQLKLLINSSTKKELQSDEMNQLIRDAQAVFNKVDIRAFKTKDDILGKLRIDEQSLIQQINASQVAMDKQAESARRDADEMAKLGDATESDGNKMKQKFGQNDTKLVEKAETVKQEVIKSMQGIKSFLDSDLDTDGIVTKYLFGENGVKTRQQMVAEIESEIKQISSDLYKKNATKQDYIKALEEPFRKIQVMQSLLGFNADENFNGTLGYYEEWRTSENNSWMNSYNNLSDDAYSYFGMAIDNQKRLNLLQRNGGQDYVDYMEQAKTLSEQLYAAVDKNKDYKQTYSEDLDITQEEANEKARGLREEADALNELIQSIETFNSENDDFKSSFSDQTPLGISADNVARRLKEKAETMEYEADKYENYTHHKLREQERIFEQGLSEKMSGDVPKEIEREYEKLETTITSTANSGQQAIDAFNKKAEELGYTFDETAKKWEKIGTSTPKMSKAAKAFHDEYEETYNNPWLDINWSEDERGSIGRIADRLKELYDKRKEKDFERMYGNEVVSLMDIARGGGYEDFIDEEGNSLLSKNIQKYFNNVNRFIEARKLLEESSKYATTSTSDDALSSGETGVEKNIVSLDRYRNKTEETTSSVTSSLNQQGQQFEQLGASAIRILSEIGLSYDDYITKINGQKRDMNWGERLATVANGKIVESIKGFQTQVGWTDDIKLDDTIEKILHLHPNGKGQAEVFSSEDILGYFDKVLSQGYNIPFELWQNGQKTSLDFRGMSQKIIPHVITALSQVDQVVRQNLKQNGGTIKSEFDDQYQQLTNSLFKAIMERYGGSFETDKDIDSKIDTKFIKDNLKILEEYTHYIRGDRDGEFHGEDDASSFMFLKSLFNKIKNGEEFIDNEISPELQKLVEKYEDIKSEIERLLEIGDVDSVDKAYHKLTDLTNANYNIRALDGERFEENQKYFESLQDRFREAEKTKYDKTPFFFEQDQFEEDISFINEYRDALQKILNLEKQIDSQEAFDKITNSKEWKEAYEILDRLEQIYPKLEENRDNIMQKYSSRMYEDAVRDILDSKVNLTDTLTTFKPDELKKLISSYINANRELIQQMYNGDGNSLDYQDKIQQLKEYITECEKAYPSLKKYRDDLLMTNNADEKNNTISQILHEEELAHSRHQTTSNQPSASTEAVDNINAETDALEREEQQARETEEAIEKKNQAEAESKPSTPDDSAESVDESVEAISQEKKLFEDLKTAAQDAAKAKDEFAKANGEVLSSIVESLKGLNAESDGFKNLNKLIGNLANNKDDRITNLVKNLERIRDILNEPLNENAFIEAIRDIAKQGDSLKDLVTVLEASQSQIDKAKNAVQDQLKENSSNDVPAKEFINNDSLKKYLNTIQNTFQNHPVELATKLNEAALKGEVKKLAPSIADDFNKKFGTNISSNDVIKAYDEIIKEEKKRLADEQKNEELHKEQVKQTLVELNEAREQEFQKAQEREKKRLADEQKNEELHKKQVEKTKRELETARKEQVAEGKKTAQLELDNLHEKNAPQIKELMDTLQKYKDMRKRIASGEPIFGDSIDEVETLKNSIDDLFKKLNTNVAVVDKPILDKLKRQYQGVDTEVEHIKNIKDSKEQYNALIEKIKEYYNARKRLAQGKPVVNGFAATSAQTKKDIDDELERLKKNSYNSKLDKKARDLISQSERRVEEIELESKNRQTKNKEQDVINESKSRYIELLKEENKLLLANDLAQKSGVADDDDDVVTREKKIKDIKDEKESIEELLKAKQEEGFINEQTKKYDEKFREAQIENTRKAEKAEESFQKKRIALAQQITQWLKANPIANQKYGAELSEGIKKLNSEAKLTPAELKEIEKGFAQIKLNATAAGETGSGFLRMLKERWKSLGAYIGSFASFYQVINYFKQMVNSVRELDDALTEMRKVSNESLSSLQSFQKESFNIADAVGSTAKVIQDSTADWMRLGESLEEAKESAKNASILLNVSEFSSIDEATTALVAMSQAYSDMDKIDIIDKLNNIGNNFSISTDQLATGLQNAAAVLKTQGNDIDKSIALLTAANSIVQDISKASTGIRTIALRIAGTETAKAELEEMGESVDDYIVQTTSKTQATIKAYTAVASNAGKGVDVLDSNGNLRDTYDILLDISKVYKEIQEEDKKSGTNRAKALVEYIAGKNRSNIAASVLENPELLEKVYEASQDSVGSAMEENEKYLDSISGHIAQLQNQLQKLYSDTIGADLTKGFIDFLKIIVELIDKVGLLKTAFIGLGTIVGTKKLG